jgi:hypothetical protein
LKARKEQDPSFSQSTEELRRFPDNATEGSWFLSLLLQKISDNLKPNQRLIIAIDALDSVDSNSQQEGTNLFYLPRYLPEKIYFILTRRPYNREKSGLLLETPSQTLNLAEYPEQNRQDVQAYIHQNLIPLAEEKLHISKEEFCDRITNESENNFMYASQIISAIAENLYPELCQHHQLPSGLEAYYQQHWQKMQGNGLSAVALRVLKILVQQLKPISVEDIAEIIDEDEYDVEEVLEDWTEFLTQQQIDGKTYYSLYHYNFRDWLVQKTR